MCFGVIQTIALVLALLLITKDGNIVIGVVFIDMGIFLC